MEKIKFSIHGMTCVVCSSTCQKSIQKLDGVKSCNVNFASGVALVEYDKDKVTPKDIYDAVSRSGYKAAKPSSKGERRQTYRNAGTVIFVARVRNVEYVGRQISLCDFSRRQSDSLYNHSTYALHTRDNSRHAVLYKRL